MSLPAGRRRLARTFRSPSSRLSKPAPRTRPIRSLCEDIGTCGGRIFFASGVAWTHAGRRLRIVMITRVASAVARELAARIFFHDRRIRQWREYFLRCRAVATAVAVARAASHGTQRGGYGTLSKPTCAPAKVMELICRLPTCRVQASIALQCCDARRVLRGSVRVG